MTHLVTDAQAQELRTFGCISTSNFVKGGALVIMTNPEDIYSDLLDTREALIEALGHLVEMEDLFVAESGVPMDDDISEAVEAVRPLLSQLKGEPAAVPR